MTKHVNKFTVLPTWKPMLEAAGIDIPMLLREAKLPADLFTRDKSMLTSADYFHMWELGNKQVPDGLLALKLAKAINFELFDVPLFACMCSKDFVTAVKRIAKYKPLIGSFRLTIDEANKSGMTIHISQTEAVDCPRVIPHVVALGELVFFTQVARIATQTHVVPIQLCLPELPDNISAYETYFGCKLNTGKSLSITFANEDVIAPFITSNARMWEQLEPGLNQALCEATTQTSHSERVRGELGRTLASGLCQIEHIASNMAMSPRTLQRKLAQEGTSFKEILHGLRYEMAGRYLKQSHLSTADIAFMLGFDEVNSFTRAFHSWAGHSVGDHRRTLNAS
ncbi:AraC family transcriptional regulator [Alteromonas sp. KUL49]|uniref:AraC family transcriptional regulator n=1 Tax=Alteromonas sp. KUL49 TaxID=2480798 RepID=UPI00102F0B4C|nr:AraC family transcriptional regulator [Alteromonas sp. KUL49]TAP42553.1 AraC family transcriptional regulator [Alteromonas sp. KUL49]GEA10187.1 AraC family transcriptional regulator [Alteromonas sp. KUL49]